MDDRTDALIREALRRLRELETSARLAPTRKAVHNLFGESASLLNFGAALDGIGFYDATLVSPVSGAINVSADLATGAIGTGVTSVVFAHLLEMDADGEDANLSLTPGGLAFGFYVGKSNETLARKVYAGYSFKGQNCKTTGPDEGEV